MAEYEVDAEWKLIGDGLQLLIIVRSILQHKKLPSEILSSLSRVPLKQQTSGLIAAQNRKYLCEQLISLNLGKGQLNDT